LVNKQGVELRTEAVDKVVPVGCENIVNRVGLVPFQLLKSYDMRDPELGKLLTDFFRVRHSETNYINWLLSLEVRAPDQPLEIALDFVNVDFLCEPELIFDN
jgi:hypothetical protein